MNIKNIALGLVTLILLSGTVSIACAGDWPMFMHDLEHTGFSPSTISDEIIPLWTYDCDGYCSILIVANGKLFASSLNSSESQVLGKLSAIDENTGKEIWSIDMLGTPTYSNGKIYVSCIEGDSENVIKAIDENTGSVLWSKKVGYQPPYFKTPHLAVKDGKIFGYTIKDAKPGSNSIVFSFDENTKEFEWTFDAKYLGYVPECGPTVANGKVFVGSDKVYALDETTGNLIWSYHGLEDFGSWSSVGGWESLTFSAGNIICLGDNKIFAISEDTSELVWSYDTGEIHTTPAVAYNKIFSCDERSILYAIDESTGSLIWSKKMDDVVTNTVPALAVADHKIFVLGINVTGDVSPDNLGRNILLVFDENNGDIIWNSFSDKIERRGAVVEATIHQSTPAIANSKIFIGSGDGKIYCFNYTYKGYTGRPQPNTFYSFENDKFNTYDIYFKWDDTPDEGCIYPAFQYYFEAHHDENESEVNIAGYIGTQLNGIEKKAIFSIWDVWDVEKYKDKYHTTKPLSINCSYFGGEGTGVSCKKNYTWVEGEKYRLHLEKVESTKDGEIWEGSIYSENNVKTTIGRIFLNNTHDNIHSYNGYGLLKSNSVTWIERFCGECDNQPYSKVIWEGPYANDFLYKAISAVPSYAHGCPFSNVFSTEYLYVTQESGDAVVQSTNSGKNIWPELPDLTLSSEDIVFFSPNPNPKIGDEITITATIHNIGIADAGTFHVEFYDGDPNKEVKHGDPNKEVKLIASIPRPFCPAGEGINVHQTWNVEEGKYIYVRVDPLNDVIESDETNNYAVRMSIGIKEIIVRMAHIKSKSDIDNLIELAKDMGAEGISISFRDDNTSKLFYESDVIYTETYSGYDGTLLSKLIEKCHENNIKVYAWIPAIFFDQKLYEEETNWGMMEKTEGEVVGWVSPVRPEVRNHELEIIREIVRKFKEIDGIRLDHVRYSSSWQDWSEYSQGQYKDKYSEASLSDLREDTYDRDDWVNWINWRAEFITDFIIDAKKAIEEESTEPKELGVYLLPFSANADGYFAHSESGQDYEKIGEIGGLYVMPMVYWQDWTSRDKFEDWTNEKIKYGDQFSGSPDFAPVFSITRVVNETEWEKPFLEESEVRNYLARSSQITRNNGINKISLFYYPKWDLEESERVIDAFSFHCEPLIADSDGDGWSDEKEREMGTNPYSIDSDADGLKDPEDPNPTVPEKKTPGFEIVFAIVGLLAVAYLLISRK